MKKILMLLLSLWFAACNQDQQPSEATHQISNPKPVLRIFINDISQSNDWLQMPKEVLIKVLLQDSASRPVIQVAGLLIEDNSLAQTPYLSAELKPGVAMPVGDIYERKATEAVNRKAMHDFETGCTITVDELLEHLDKPRVTQSSDVNGALYLANLFAAQGCFADYDIQLIIISDLIQDTPDQEPLHPVVFPENTTIYLIGASNQLDEVAIFPKNTVSRLPGFKARFFSL